MESSVSDLPCPPRVRAAWEARVRDPERALALVRGLLDAPHEAEDELWVRLAEAAAASKLGRTRLARKSARRALELARAEDPAFPHVHAVLGMVCCDTADYDGADEHWRTAERLFAASEDRCRAAAMGSNLGLVHLNRGEFSRAIERLRAARAVQAELGDAIGQASSLHNLANTFLQCGEESVALTTYHDCLDIRRRTGDRPGIASTLNNIGVVYRTIGDYESAETYARNALAAYREQENPVGVARALANLSRALHLLGRTAEALDHEEESLALRRAAEDSRGEAESLLARGEIRRSAHDDEAALADFEEGARIFARIAHRPGESAALRLVAEAHLDLGRLDDALAAARAWLGNEQAHGRCVGEAEARIMLGRVQLRRGELPAASAAFMRALATADEIRDEALAVRARYHIADTRRAGGDVAEALRGLRAAREAERELVERKSTAEMSRLKAVHAAERALAEARLQQAKRAELATAHEELERGNQRLRDVARTIQHDLRGLLTAILYDAQPGDADAAPGKLQRIALAAGRMRDVLGRLTQPPGAPAGISRVDLAGLAHEAVTVHGGLARAKNIELQAVAPETVRPVAAEPRHVRAVLDNLVQNAIKFSPLGAKVRVCVEDNRVWVEDEGPGLTRQDRERLFTRGALLSAQPTAGETSTGLGLHIVHELVTAMGGRVWCESEPDRPTRFVVELPAASET